MEEVSIKDIKQTNPNIKPEIVSQIAALGIDAIQELGPLYVVKDIEGTMFILDGAKRLEALKLLGCEAFYVDFAPHTIENPYSKSNSEFLR